MQQTIAHLGADLEMPRADGRPQPHQQLPRWSPQRGHRRLDHAPRQAAPARVGRTHPVARLRRQ